MFTYSRNATDNLRGFLCAMLLVLCPLAKSVRSQVEWTDSDQNPVFDVGAAGAWDSLAVFARSLLEKDGEYKLWHGGRGQPGWQIGCVHSTDLFEWERAGATACFPNRPGDGHSEPSVLFDPDEGTYKMWYAEGPGTDFISPTNIGYATSVNGKDWISLEKPVLKPDTPWELSSLALPEVLFDRSRSIYRMWYVGLDWSCAAQRLGYAESTDGIEWVKYVRNPLLFVGEPENSVIVPKVLFDEKVGTLEMWFSRNCEGGTSHYATSLDGLTWISFPGPPLHGIGTPGPVLRRGDEYHMLYNGALGVGPVRYATSSWTVPKASFTVTPESPVDCGGTLEVDASRSATPNPPIENYAWDFGDGTTAIGVKTSHRYLRPGRYLIQLTVTDPIAKNEGAVARIVTVGCCRGDVKPWTSAGIGSPLLSGGARAEGEDPGRILVLCAGGRGISGRSDEFQFLYQEITGNASLMAKISDLGGGGTAARAGLMFRETLDSASRHGAVFVQRDRFVWVSRKDDGGVSRVTRGSNAAIPAWLRMERRGDDLIGSSSPDGVTWTEVSHETINSLACQVYAGIAVTGGDAGSSKAFEALEARFCGITLSQGTKFHRGDPNSSGTTDISDGITIFGFLFLGNPATLSCKESADANNDGKIDISDGIYLLNWLFVGGPEPAAPGPTTSPCGFDSDPPGSPGDLGCEDYNGCR